MQNKLIIPRNKQGVLFNRFQGSALKVLTICSAGCLRSPTAATLLSNEPFNFNTRSCGLDEEFAIVPISPALIAWADVIVTMEPWMDTTVRGLLASIIDANSFSAHNSKDRTLICLDIEDNYEFMQPELQQIMLDKFKEIFVP